MTDWPWPEPEDDGACDHLIADMAMPGDLALMSSDGRAIDLARLTGRTVVVVYPWTGGAGLSNPPSWDEIPGAHGSTPQLQGFARLHRGFGSVMSASLVFQVKRHVNRPPFRRGSSCHLTWSAMNISPCNGRSICQLLLPAAHGTCPVSR